MTDKEKIRAEIERLKHWNNNVRDSGIRHMTMDEEVYNRGKNMAYDEVLFFIDSMQEEPQELVVKQIEKLGWNMYHAYQYLTTDASHVRKAMKEWYNYINFELNKQEKAVHRTKADVDAAMAEIEEKSKAFTEAHEGETSEEILAQMRGEEPSISDIVDECWWEMLDPNIMYASREEGIKALAEDYSFNVESELFQQLTKEQQGLWRKEIEQACIHGSYGGLNLANDKRYDQEEPVSEKNKLMALSDGKQHLGWLDDANALDCPTSEELEEEIGRYFKENGDKWAYIDVARHFANWQKQRMIEKVCKWLAL